jgi:fructuronate reductase
MTAHPPQRLSMATLAGAHVRLVPPYERSGVQNITHLGVGAFARAHLGVYADDLNRRGWPASIRGISVMSDRAERDMGPQDGLYTVAEREPDEEVALRVVGSITSVRTGAAAAVEAIAAPTTDLVTVTITESGYDIPPAPSNLQPASPSVPEIIARALAQRRRAGSGPPIIASLDNLLGNGTILRQRVMEMADRLDSTLPRWIADEVTFPSSVVDRMVPAPTDDDVADVEARLGLLDLATVSAERYRSWIISSAAALPPFADVGVQVVADVTQFERRKLWLLNGPHSAFAYCGLLAGCDTIAAAVVDATVFAYVREMIDDTLEVAQFPASLGATRFAHDALHRFANPALGHTCLQVGADGSRKLPQRFLPIVEARRAARLDTSRFATVVALWIASVGGLEVQGVRLPAAADPEAPRLRAAVLDGGLSRVVDMALGRTYDPVFCEMVVASLRHLSRDGLAVLSRDTR